MRSILSNQLNYIPEDLNLENLKKSMFNLKDKINSFCKNKGNIQIQEIQGILSQINDFSYVNNQSKIYELINSLEENIKNMLTQDNRSWTNGLTYSIIGKELLTLFNESATEEFKKNINKLKPKNFKLVYVPILSSFNSYLNITIMYFNLIICHRKYSS